MKQVMLLKVKRGGVECSLNKEVTTSYRKIKKLRPLIVRKEGVDETVDDGTEEVAVVHQEVLSCRELYLDRT